MENQISYPHCHKNLKFSMITETFECPWCLKDLRLPLSQAQKTNSSISQSKPPSYTQSAYVTFLYILSVLCFILAIYFAFNGCVMLNSEYNFIRNDSWISFIVGLIPFILGFHCIFKANFYSNLENNILDLKAQVKKLQKPAEK